MSDPLAPCPFCGDASAYLSTPPVTGIALGYAASVSCTACKAVMLGYGPEDVTAAWNRRAAPPLPEILFDRKRIAVCSGDLVTWNEDVTVEFTGEKRLTLLFENRAGERFVFPYSDIADNSREVYRGDVDDLHF